MARILAVLLLVTACAPLPPNGDAGVDAGVDAGDPFTGWCARETTETTSDGFAVTVCEEAFATPPLVRAPADTTDFIYGGVQRGAQGDLELAGRTRSFTLTTMPAWLVRESSASNMRYPYFVYRARVSGGVVEDVVPVARIDERVMQRLLTGKIFEGLASARITDGGTEVRYEYLDLTVPIRVRLDAMVQAAETDRLYGYPRYAVLGRIENATSGTRASDGGCFPALASLGERSPIFGATGMTDQVTILRHPNMHGGLDDVFTFAWPAGVSAGNNMGGGLFVSTASLLRSTAPILTRGSSHPHGTPWGGPSAELHEVQSGGAMCTP